MNSIAGFLMLTFRTFGILGCIAIILAISITAADYHGTDGQRYSFVNHYISELGEVGVSSRAGVFNAGMMLSGVLFIPFTVGLGLTLSGGWGILGALAGSWAGISCFLVGVYPMNNITPHARVAISYFRAGLTTILLFSIAIATQNMTPTVISTRVNWVGLAAILSYGSFLALTHKPKPVKNAGQPADPPVIVERPRFWLAPALEWVVFITTILWFICVALSSR